jgi:hypothetical protein
MRAMKPVRLRLANGHNDSRKSLRVFDVQVLDFSILVDSITFSGFATVDLS